MVWRKYISCQMFRPYIERILSNPKEDIGGLTTNDRGAEGAEGIGTNTPAIEYVDIEVHNEPQKLRMMLQDRIDAHQDVDEIVLLYGICGNAVDGLVSKHARLLLFRVHDCLAVLLGSNERYRQVVEVEKIGCWKCEGNHGFYLERRDRSWQGGALRVRLQSGCTGVNDGAIIIFGKNETAILDICRKIFCNVQDGFFLRFLLK